MREADWNDEATTKECGQTLEDGRGKEEALP